MVIRDKVMAYNGDTGRCEETNDISEMLSTAVTDTIAGDADGNLSQIDTDGIFKDINDSVSGVVHDWLINQALRHFIGNFWDAESAEIGIDGDRIDPTRQNGAIMATRAMASKAFRMAWANFVQPVIHFFVQLVGYVLWLLQFIVENLFSWMRFSLNRQTREVDVGVGVGVGVDDGGTEPVDEDSVDLVASVGDTIIIVLSYSVFIVLVVFWFYALKKMIRIYQCKRKVD